MMTRRRSVHLRQLPVVAELHCRTCKHFGSSSRCDRSRAIDAVEGVIDPLLAKTSVAEPRLSHDWFSARRGRSNVRPTMQASDA